MPNLDPVDKKFWYKFDNIHYQKDFLNFLHLLFAVLSKGFKGEAVVFAVVVVAIIRHAVEKTHGVSRVKSLG